MKDNEVTARAFLDRTRFEYPNTAAIMQAYADEQNAALIAKVEGLEQKYNELLFAVARKFPNETRHETALRYINEAETLPDSVASEALKETEQ